MGNPSAPRGGVKKVGVRDITNTLLCLLKRQLLRMVVVRVAVTAEVTETCRRRGVRSLGGLRKSLCRRFQVLQVFFVASWGNGGRV